MFEAIVGSHGWDGVTAALQLLSHLDGDALNVAFLVPESRRVVPGFLIKSLSDHYNAPGRLAGYKRQFQRACRRPGDDPSIFAIDLETPNHRLSTSSGSPACDPDRAFIDIDTPIQLLMVWDRFINGQAECALCRHLDRLGPHTPMADIVDCCRVWECHCKVESTPRMNEDRCAVCQVTEDEPIHAALPETGNWEDIIRKLLPMPAPPSPPAVPIPSDQEVLIPKLIGVLCPPTPVARVQSPATALEAMLLNWLQAGAVTEEDAASPDTSVDSAEGYFSCGEYDGPMQAS